MSHEVLLELEWIGALLVLVVAFAASTALLVIARHMPPLVKQNFLWLAAAGFLGIGAAGTTTILHLLHFTVDRALWNLHPLFFLGSAAAFAVATRHFAELSERLEELSKGTETFS